MTGAAAGQWQDACSQCRSDDPAVITAEGDRHWRSAALGSACKSLRTLHPRLNQWLAELQHAVQRFNTPAVVAPYFVLAAFVSCWCWNMGLAYAGKATDMAASSKWLNNDAVQLPYMVAGVLVTALVCGLAAACVTLACFVVVVCCLPPAVVWLLTGALPGALRALELLLVLLDSLCAIFAEVHRPGSLCTGAGCISSGTTGCPPAPVSASAVLWSGAAPASKPPAVPQVQHTLPDSLVPAALQGAGCSTGMAPDTTQAPVVVQQLQGAIDKTPSRQHRLLGARVAERLLLAGSCAIHVGRQSLEACSGGPCTRPLAAARCQLDHLLARVQRWISRHTMLTWLCEAWAGVPAVERSPVPCTATVYCSTAVPVSLIGCSIAGGYVQEAMSSQHGWAATIPGAAFINTLYYFGLIVAWIMGIAALLLAPTAAVALLRVGVWAAWLVAVLLVGLPAECLLAGCSAVWAGRAVGSSAAAAPVSAHSLLRPDGCPRSAAAAARKGRADQPLTKPADAGVELAPLVKPPAEP